MNQMTADNSAKTGQNAAQSAFSNAQSLNNTLHSAFVKSHKPKKPLNLIKAIAKLFKTNKFGAACLCIAAVPVFVLLLAPFFNPLSMLEAQLEGIAAQWATIENATKNIVENDLSVHFLEIFNKSDGRKLLNERLYEELKKDGVSNPENMSIAWVLDDTGFDTGQRSTESTAGNTFEGKEGRFTNSWFAPSMHADYGATFKASANFDCQTAVGRVAAYARAVDGVLITQGKGYDGTDLTASDDESENSGSDVEKKSSAFDPIQFTQSLYKYMPDMITLADSGQWQVLNEKQQTEVADTSTGKHDSAVPVISMYVPLKLDLTKYRASEIEAAAQNLHDDAEANHKSLNMTPEQEADFEENHSKDHYMGVLNQLIQVQYTSLCAEYNINTADLSPSIDGGLLLTEGSETYEKEIERIKNDLTDAGYTVDEVQTPQFLQWRIMKAYDQTITADFKTPQELEQKLIDSGIFQKNDESDHSVKEGAIIFVHNG